jgi:predicted RNA binding protein YcfA (HicA-like mRNA interferase family)
MSALSINKIVSSMTKKGFTISNGSKHIHLIFYYNTKKTTIWTVYSKSATEIGSSLINKMAKQIKLNNSQFYDFIECTLTKEDYVEILITNKYI